LPAFGSTASQSATMSDTYQSLLGVTAVAGVHTPVEAAPKLVITVLEAAGDDERARQKAASSRKAVHIVLNTEIGCASFRIKLESPKLRLFCV
jgi:hypothetical protein